MDIISRIVKIHIIYINVKIVIQHVMEQIQKIAIEQIDFQIV